MEVKVETQRLRKVCMLLRLHMQEELSAGEWTLSGAWEEVWRMG
jgi:hypothetical protein